MIGVARSLHNRRLSSTIGAVALPIETLGIIIQVFFHFDCTFEMKIEPGMERLEEREHSR